MRILAIRGQNLASLARAFEVDLTRGALRDAGLFAITGPVGAGKSTLLDALCLPLFDRTPRLSGRGGPAIGDHGQDPGEWLRGNDPRGLLRRDAVEGFAEVDFVGRDGRRYRARWSVRRARRQPDGRLQEQELSLLDLDAQRFVANGRRSEVLAAVAQRLGLDFQQFCRSVLLAQGEFAAFLRAAADERARLLENLTGADVYRRLSRAAHEGRRRREQDLAALEANGRAQPQLGPEERAQLERAVASREGEVSLHRTAVVLAQRYVTWYAAAAAHRERESGATVALQQAIAANDAASPRREALARRQRALPMVPRLERVTEAQKDLAAAIAAREQAQATANTAAVTAQQIAARLAQALGEAWPGVGEPPPVVAEFERWRQPLQRWRERDREAVAAGRGIDAARAAAAAAGAGAAAAAAKAVAADAAVVEAEQRAAAASQALAAFDHAALPARRAAVGADAAALQQLRDHVAQWQRAAHAAAEAVRARAELVQQREQCAGEFAAHVAAREGAEQALHAAREAFEQARTRAGLAQFRAALRPEAPCPLCGSTAHPSPLQAHAGELEAARVAAESADARWRLAHEAVVRAESTRQSLERALAAVATSAAATAKAAATARATVAQEVGAVRFGCAGPAAVASRGREPATVEAAAAWLQRLGDALDGERAALTAVEVAVEAARAEVETHQRGAERARDAARRCGLAANTARADLDAAQQRLDGALAAHSTAAASAAELAETLAPAFPTSDWQGALRDADAVAAVQRLAAMARQREESATRAAAAAGEAARTVAEVAQRQVAMQRADETFRTAIAQAEVSPREVREAADTSAAELQREAAALRELEIAVERAREAVATHARLRHEHEAGGRPEIAEGDAARALDDARAGEARVEKELGELRAKRDLDDLVRRQLAELAPRIAAATRDLDTWRALDDLIGSSTGDAFAIYAQGITLDLLLLEANDRLRELARRYRLERVPGGEMDFVVADLELGGTRRSLQSLSGGETFLVSLALALALATLAAPRARVETLFLDEGFGTLDAQNLEAALGALDVLQAGGCQVGVISHVDGIAERIGAVVEVRPEGSGQSRVVARAR